MKILVLNAGSSSLKYSLFVGADSHLALHGLIEHLGETPHEVTGITKTHADALLEVEAQLLEAGLVKHLGDCDAVSHRVVHGGEAFHEATLVNETVMQAIDDLSQLAPLHNPANLLPMRILAEKYPGLVQIAVFDTAFHHTLPDYAFHYALPKDLYEQHQIRRYGFHGTSHQYIAKTLADILELPDDEVHLISLHLGNGASVCAIEHGESIDTSMGFTPLEGLVMGTRTGDLDPAIPLYLIRQLGYSAAEVDHLLNKESGLKGLCGFNDMRDVIDAANAGDGDAQMALDLFTYRINKIAGSYLAVMDEVDALVFTGGIGEHAPMVREMILNGFSTRLGIEIDYAANETARGMTCITLPSSRIQAWVIPTDEEFEIAQQTLDVLQG
ncbi:acetate/propionate family kinase [Thiosulfativibrio zosterae]|uniref:Acetate kinase n=1 Tax=Thiosulfativibrio zosterae TaxID=2675053 RepID=A0A6F8PJV6_9GAMM|nr:acetate kinase [Thiosulfativibrio zosterae]BBP42379.1 acetate kinase [Thiosulfativibrio zosterae]